MQIRRSEKCVWQNRTAEREENDMGLQDDRMSGNIQDIARLITRLLLKGDMPQYTLPAAEADYTEADRLFKKVIGLADEGDINGAENELLMNMEDDDPDYLELALTFYLYLNEDYSDDPTTFAFDWYNTENGEYIQLDDIVLSSEGDGSNLETTLDQMMTTASVIEYVAQGTYWIGSGDETAMIFYFEDDQAYFDLLYNDNGQIQTQSISGIWSLDYDHLNLIDDETGVSYELGWDLSEEGDSYCFELTEDDTTYYLYESAAEDVDSTLDILTSYLTAEDSVDVESDDIDLSDFLEGYEGHSVIDAFMLSGISPDFETRKYCAELLGFVNYSGTSDENLALIQLMGGTVQ